MKILALIFSNRKKSNAACIVPVYLLLAAAGLFWMFWHLLAARFLWQSAKESK